MQTSALSIIDYVVMAISLVIVVMIALVCSRWIKDAGQIFAAGGRLPWWLSGTSQIMTAVSAGTWTIWGSIAFCYGWVGISLNWLAAIGTAVAALFFVARWKRSGVKTVPEWFALRYNDTTRTTLMSVWILFMYLAVAMQLYSVCLFISHVTPFSLNQVILFTGLLITFATTIGGLWAVTITNFIQAVILNLACFLLIPLALNRAGGWSAVIDKTPDHFFNLAAPEATGYGFALLIPFLLVRIVTHSTQWSLVQHYISVPDEVTAKKSAWLCSALFFICPVIWLLPAIIFRVIEPDFATIDGHLSLQHAERAYAHVSLIVLPPGFMGLMLAAMYAATVSTLNSEFVVMASTLTNEVYLKYVFPDASSKRVLNIGRLAIVLVGIAITLLAILVKLMGGAVQVAMGLFGIMTGPLGIPLLWGLFSRRCSRWSALFAAVIGIGASLFVRFGLPAMGIVTTTGQLMTVNILVPVVIMLLFEFIRPVTGNTYEQINALFTRFAHPVKSPETLIESRSTDLRLFGVIGFALVLMSLSMLIVLIVETQQRFWILMAFLILIVPGLLFMGVGYHTIFFQKWTKKK